MNFKRSLLLCMLIFCTAPVLTSASTTLTYSPFTIQHSGDYLFDLTKGNPQGMRNRLYYTLTCQTSATGDTVLAMAPSSYSPGNSVEWGRIGINGDFIASAGASQFKLPMNATFSLEYVYFPDTAFATIQFTNLDNQVDVTMTCYGAPWIH